jgi:hypothetical protein
MMSVIEPSTIHRSGSPCGDELDNVLHVFFQAEMPKPWPELKPPVETAIGQEPLHRLPRISPSRLALAASVAILLGTQSLLYHAFKVDEPPTTNVPSAIDVAEPASKRIRAREPGHAPRILNEAKTPLPRPR